MVRMIHETNEKDLSKILRELMRSSEENSKLIKATVEELKRVVEKLKQVDEKLDQILAPARVLMLPDHLRPAMITVQQLGEATAKQVAERTGRARATESDYLNQLVRTGCLKKRKVGRTTYFSPIERI